MRNIKMAGLIALAYIIATASTLIYTVWVGLAVSGDRCFTSSEPCGPITEIVQYSPPLIFGILTATFIYWFFKSTKAKRNYKVFYESIYIAIIIYFGYYIGNNLSKLFHEPYQNTTPEEIYAKYTGLLMGILVSFALSVYINLHIHQKNK